MVKTGHLPVNWHICWKGIKSEVITDLSIKIIQHQIWRVQKYTIFIKIYIENKYVVRFGAEGRGGGVITAVRRRGGQQDDWSVAGWRKRGHWGNHGNQLPFLVRVLGHVRLYREYERGGGRLKIEEPQHFYEIQGFHIWGPRSLGGWFILPRRPPNPPASKYYQLHRSSGSSPRAPGSPVGQKVKDGHPSIGYKPVGRQSVSQPVKVQCSWRWRSASTLSGSGRAAVEEEITSTRESEVG